MDNWSVEIFRFASGLIGAMVGGGLVILGGWLADRRKEQLDDNARDREEHTLFTGMFAVSNFISERLNDVDENGRVSSLLQLRTAQAYVHRLIDRAPSESDRVMVVIIDIGLRIDALIATVDRFLEASSKASREEIAADLDFDISGLTKALDTFDTIATGVLPFVTEEELGQFLGYDIEEASSDTDKLPK
jgi:hypothetical protein